MKVYRISETGDLYYSDQYFIAAETASRAVEFYYSLTNKSKGQYSGYAKANDGDEVYETHLYLWIERGTLYLPQPDGTVVEKDVEEYLAAIPKDTETPILLSKIESVRMYTVGWNKEAAEYAIIARDEDAAIKYYYFLIGSERTAEIWYEGQGMGGYEFKQNIIREVPGYWEIEIADENGKRTSNVEWSVSEMVHHGCKFPMLYGKLRKITPDHGIFPCIKCEFSIPKGGLEYAEEVLSNRNFV